MTNAHVLFALLSTGLATGAPVKKLDLAKTPPMGWNSWNGFAAKVDESLIRATADAMVATGMKDVGYQYVNIDDGWQGKRDEKGFIHPSTERFPSGMKALSDYVHGKGLKLGIYSDAGDKTCGGYPGSRGHEYQDALSFAEWGVDYVKYDWCNTDDLSPIGSYTTMRDASLAAGRPMIFSICEWGNSKPWLWAPAVGHLWRTTGDIFAAFEGKLDHGGWNSWGFLQILDMQKGLREFSGPGHFNDPDMLEVGNGMSTVEDRAHFSIWAMLAAPLIAGNDLRTMSADTLAILTNTDVVAIDQDPLGLSAFPFSSVGGIEVWIKPLANGAWALCALNRTARPQKFQFDWKKQSVSDPLSKREARFDTAIYSIRDLWSKKDLGTTKAVLNADLESHDVLLLRLQRAKK